MELLRTKDNEIEALRKKLRVKKEKIHKLRRQLADLKERFGDTLYNPPLPSVTN
jgi:predicted RNase H-like nuclease (RuvC/YqgF family)